MTEEEYAYFSQAHNVCINASEYSEIQKEVALVIGQAFATDPDHLKYCETDKQREYFRTWTNNTDNTDLTDVDRLICTALML